MEFDLISTHQTHTHSLSVPPVLSTPLKPQFHRKPRKRIKKFIINLAADHSQDFGKKINDFITEMRARSTDPHQKMLPEVSHQHMCIHTLTHTLTHTLPHSLTHSLTPSLSHSHTHSHSHTSSLTLTHTLTHSHTHPHSHSHTHPFRSVTLSPLCTIIYFNTIAQDWSTVAWSHVTTSSMW